MVNGTSKKNFTYTYNPYSWNQEYNMIFIDNPIGTGLSYAENFFNIPVNQEEVAADFYAGLESLYKDKNGCFNELNLTESPLVITGESYAGKYVPSICNYILD
jgi:vitellogenic carboxypeptidase-like protein/serine carboxypeptidase 1